MTLTQSESGSALSFSRFYTNPGEHPFDQIEWEWREARIPDHKSGTDAFYAPKVEFPVSWSQNATNIVAQKYFRVIDGVRETSLRQTISRIAGTIANWGSNSGYFDTTDAAYDFECELSYLMVNQMAAFNSPVWFNIGVPGAIQTSSACFLLNVEDSMSSILNWITEEGLIFKGGSGSGVNLSKLRSTKEALGGGGTSSGPVSFMRGADASAGAIKSGGTCLAPWQHVYTTEGPKKVSELAESGGKFVALSYDPPAGRYKAKWATAWLAGHKEVLRVTTDKGTFDASFDHPYKLSSGDYRLAKDLKSGNSLFSCTIDITKKSQNGIGYARVGLHDGAKGKRLVHQLVMEDILGVDPRGFSIHHDDENTLNNSPDNLFLKSQSDHAREHNLELVEKGAHVFQNNYFGKTGENNPMSASGAFWKNREKSDALRQKQRENLLERGDARELQKLAARQKQLNTAFKLLNAGYTINTFDEYWAARKAYGMSTVDAERVQQSFIKRYGSYEGFLDEVAAANHRVISIVSLGTFDVYDVEVDCPTEDDKSAHTGHNFVIWPNSEQCGSGVCVANTRRSAKLVRLDIDHPDIEEFITCKVDAERKARVLRSAGYDMDLDGVDSNSLPFQNANNSVGITDEFMHAYLDDKDWNLRAVTTGETIETVKSRHLMKLIAEAAWECADPGVQFDTTINKWHTSPAWGRIETSNPCSEYFSNTNTSCNLSSLRLTKFLREDDTFDVESFKKAVRIMFIAQDILIEHSDSPTEAITKGTKAHRQIGLGYTDLGALLMELGYPYDSDDGRALTAAITTLLTATAYLTSTELAESLGAYPAYTDGDNRESTLKVLQMHRSATTGLIHSLDGTTAADAEGIAGQAANVWDLVITASVEYGVRNAQSTLLAPTGTISFSLDCDTTSAEPDFSLVKNKKLVGGGTMKIVNQAVPRALKRMKYDDETITKIVDYIFEHGSALGAPGLKPEHLPVFACAVSEPSIAPMGHLKMMGAIQPFISGAISKTCNLPEDSTVEDIERLYVEAWKMGLKSLAVYRDNCKVGQPLSTNSKVVVPAQIAEKITEKRERLPKKRTSYTQSFRLGDSKGYLHVGEYPDGRPGEVFLRMSKQGNTLLGVLDGLATAMSLGLQHGVPLESFVDKFINTRFAPQGFTDDVELRSATSILDFIARRLAVEYMTYEERSQLGILTVQENATHTAPKAEQTDEPEYAPTAAQEVLAKTTLRTRTEDLCGQCGGHMIKAGTCHVCETCGTTTGCS